MDRELCHLSHRRVTITREGSHTPLGPRPHDIEGGPPATLLLHPRKKLAVG
jgi:hypothetical protein